MDASDFGSRKVETEFYIPKARNPNGEATIKVLYDKDSNDYEKVEGLYGTPQESIPDQKPINF
jgi:hypothetical protein